MGIDPFSLALIAGGTAAISGAASIFGNRSQARAQERENRPYREFQERRNQLIDQLLAGISGGGRFAGLFDTSDEEFQRSYIDPSKARFSNQIAPQIQQQAIAGGSQRSSTTDDQLLRAGVDINALLDEAYAGFREQGRNRQFGAINTILGGQAPTPLTAPPTGMAGAAGAISGFAQSPAFGAIVGSYMNPSGTSTAASKTGFQGTQAQRDLLSPPPPTSGTLLAGSGRSGYGVG